MPWRCWWGDGTVVEEMDVRPGGTYRFRTAFGVVEGEYREVVAPERLVQTFQNHLQTLEFEDLGDRTKLTQTIRFATTEERDTTMSTVSRKARRAASRGSTHYSSGYRSTREPPSAGARSGLSAAYPREVSECADSTRRRVWESRSVNSNWSSMESSYSDTKTSAGTALESRLTVLFVACDG